MKLKETHSIETFVAAYKTKHNHNSENLNRHIHRLENLKSQTVPDLVSNFLCSVRSKQPVKIRGPVSRFVTR
jgi:hypothetical protein